MGLVPAGLAAQCDGPSVVTLGDAYECFFENSPEIKSLRDETSASVVAANNPVTPPDAFGGRIHSSYQDFLNLLSFAVNKVEESDDGQALVVRFNPLRRGTNLLGSSLTIAKPTLFEGIVDAIPAAQRPAATSELEKQLEDTDDLIWALSYSYQSRRCDEAKLTNSRCWGRSPAIYRQALSGLLVRAAGGAVEAADPSQEDFIAVAQTIAQTVPGFSGSVFALNLQQLPADQRASILGNLQKAAEANAEQTVANQKLFESSGIGELATLLDNQPQLALTGSYRDRAPLGGPDESSVTLELQFGGTNLNSVYSECNGDLGCVAAKLPGFAGTDVSTLPTGKFVLSASYTQQDEYNRTTLNLPADLATFSGVTLKKNDELKVRLQAGWQLKGNLGGLSQVGQGTASPQNARWDFAVEGIRNSEGEVLTENRWVATASLTVPLNAQMSVPLTVTYANKPEFLGDVTKQYGAHLGITYRIPWSNPAQ